MKRAALYVRVSTDKQLIEHQVRELRQVAERRGWDVVETYTEVPEAAPCHGQLLPDGATPCFGRRAYRS